MNDLRDEFRAATESFAAQPGILSAIHHRARVRVKRIRLVAASVALGVSALAFGALLVALRPGLELSRPESTHGVSPSYEPTPGASSKDLGTFYPPDGASGIIDVSNGVYIWGVKSSGNAEISRIDPDSGAILASAPAPFAGRAGGNPIATDGSSIFLGGSEKTSPAGSGGVVVAFNAENLSDSRVFALGGSFVSGLGIGPDGDLWAAVQNGEYYDGRIVQLDPTSGAVLKETRVQGLMSQVVVTRQSVFAMVASFSPDNVLTGTQITVVHKETMEAAFPVNDEGLFLLTQPGTLDGVIAIAADTPGRLLSLQEEAGDPTPLVSDLPADVGNPSVSAVIGSYVWFVTGEPSGTAFLVRVDTQTSSMETVDLPNHEGPMSIAPTSSGVAVLTSQGDVILVRA